MLDQKSEDELEKAGPSFDPPMYIQRYKTVKDFLYKLPGIIRVVDFGCADGKFLKYLKNLPFVEEIAAVDINEQCVEAAEIKARPLAWDYLIKRHCPLTIKLYTGSIAESDYRLLGFDAVIGIELIEHLTPSVLLKLPENVFGYIQPKVAIFTTPNSEFNVLFPGRSGFRHWDHKFEWSREEFREWCVNVTQLYPSYSFELCGIGEPPDESSELGCCTQMAIFKRNQGQKCKFIHNGESENFMPYTLFSKWDYPGREQNMNENSIVQDSCDS